MVQIIDEQPSFLQKIGRGIGMAGMKAAEEIPSYFQEREKQKATISFAKRLGLGDDFHNLDPAMQRLLATNALKGTTKKPIAEKDMHTFLKHQFMDDNKLAQLSPKKRQQMLEYANSLLDDMDEDQAKYMAYQKFVEGDEGLEEADISQAKARGEEDQLYPPWAKRPEGYEKKSSRLDGEDGKIERPWFSKAVDAPRDIFKEKGDIISRGAQSSISGRAASLLGGENIDDFNTRTGLSPEEDSFINRLLYGGGNLASDLPYMAAGGYGGAAIGSAAGPIGATVGAGAGAIGLKEALSTGLEEFHKAISSGFEGDFEDFVNSAAKTANAGIYGALEGAIFSTLSKALPLLKTMPQTKSLFGKSGKVGDKIISAVIETGGLVGAESLAKGELPSPENVADMFALVLGAGAALELPQKIYNKVSKSGKAQEVTRALQQEIEAGRLDPNNFKEVKRVINDITESFEGTEIDVSRDVFEGMKDRKAIEPRKEAEALAERPIDKTIEDKKKKDKAKERPLTEKETAKREKAKEDASKMQNKIDTAQGDISALEEVIENPKTKNKDKALYEAALKSKKEEIGELQKKQRSLEAISEKGVAPFSKESLKEPIELHNEKLKEAAKDPLSLTAKEWETMFKEDQKYVREFEDLLKKKDLPKATYKDRYIKILDAYQESYKNLGNEIQKTHTEKAKASEGLNKRTKAYKEAKKELDYYKRALDLIQTNEKINKAKIGRQVDKLSQLYALEKPGSSLTKQILKDLRRDVPDLQKDFVKQIKRMDAIEKKVESQFKEKAKRVEGLIKEYQKSPRDVTLRRVSEETGISVREAQDLKNEAQQTSKKVVDDAIAGKPQEGVEKTLFDKFKDRYPKNKWARAFIVGAVLTHLQEGVEKLTGTKVPITPLGLLLRSLADKSFTSGTTMGFSTFGIAHVYKRAVNEVYKKIREYQYKNLRTFKEKSKFIDELKDAGYSNSQIKSITGR